MASLAPAVLGLLLLLPPGLDIPSPLMATRQSASADPRIRPTDEPSRALLREALNRSATLSALVADIECSDVLVFLVGSTEPGNWRGDIRLLTAAAGLRMLSIRINMTLTLNERIGVLGHELQHVREIAEAPHVGDHKSMRLLFEQIGYGLSPAGNGFETRAAQAVERRVLEEITRRRDALNWPACPPSQSV